MNIHKQRLLNVARALRESPAPKQFTMRRYGHFCGTPACAMGHYAIRRDLQDTFGLSREGVLLRSNIEMDLMAAIKDHFNIIEHEVVELFGRTGCGNAKTPHQAATYIEEFAAENWPEPKRVARDGGFESVHHPF